MMFLAPIKIAKTANSQQALWRRLFMEALPDTASLTPSDVSEALISAALLSGSPIIRVVDELIILGLRAPFEAFPTAWQAVMRGRVLDLSERENLPLPLANLVARWGWMPYPQPRLVLLPELDMEADPFGADLRGLLMSELGHEPPFGYTATHMRLALLKVAVNIGRPLAEIITALVTRGLILPTQAVPPSCRETLKIDATHPLLLEQIAGWNASFQRVADVIPFRQVAQR